MRELVGHDPALCFALERVVADRVGGLEAFLDVTCFHDRLALRIAGVLGPHPGVAVGLELDPDLDRIASRIAHLCLGVVRLVEQPLQILDVVADFYRDMGGWVAGGQVKSRDTVLDGLERMPEAFLGLFTGANTGKMLVKL